MRSKTEGCVGIDIKRVGNTNTVKSYYRCYSCGLEGFKEDFVVRNVDKMAKCDTCSRYFFNNKRFLEYFYTILEEDESHTLVRCDWNGNIVNHPKVLGYEFGKMDTEYDKAWRKRIQEEKGTRSIENKSNTRKR